MDPGDVHLHYLREGEAGMITLNRTMDKTKKDGRRDDRLRLGRGTRGLTVHMNRFYLKPSCLRMSSQREFLISECLGIAGEPKLPGQLPDPFPVLPVYLCEERYLVDNQK